MKNIKIKILHINLNNTFVFGELHSTLTDLACFNYVTKSQQQPLIKEQSISTTAGSYLFENDEKGAEVVVRMVDWLPFKDCVDVDIIFG